MVNSKIGVKLRCQLCVAIVWTNAIYQRTTVSTVSAFVIRYVSAAHRWALHNQSNRPPYDFFIQCSWTKTLEKLRDMALALALALVTITWHPYPIIWSYALFYFLPWYKSFFGEGIFNQICADIRGQLSAVASEGIPGDGGAKARAVRHQRGMSAGACHSPGCSGVLDA